MNTYQYTQTSPSNSWVIEHKLNILYPVIDVYVYVNSELTKIIPKDIIVNSNLQVTIEFSTPYTGVARIV